MRRLIIDLSIILSRFKIMNVQLPKLRTCVLKVTYRETKRRSSLKRPPSNKGFVEAFPSPAGLLRLVIAIGKEE